MSNEVRVMLLAKNLTLELKTKLHCKIERLKE